MTYLFPRSALTFRLCPILLLVLLAGCGKKPDAAEPAAATVETEEAKWITYGEKVELIGTTQPLPNRLAQISTTVEARVLEVLPKRDGKEVHEGDTIDVGRAIVQLDDRIPRANRAKLAATLDDLEAQVNQADYAIELAQIEVNKLNELKSQEKAGAAALPLTSRVAMTQAAVALKDAQSKKVSASARAKAAKAELDALDKQLEYYTLRAPFAGQLGLVRAVPGQNLAAGTAVAEVVNLDELDVLCYVPGRAVRQLGLDQDAVLEGEDHAGGKVVFIAAQALPETGNFAVKIRFPNKDGALRANTLVHLSVITKPEIPHLCVPESALMEDTDPPTLFIVEEVEENGEKVSKAVKVKVTEMGARERSTLHVFEPKRLVKAADKTKEVKVSEATFIVKGAAGLHDGDEVKGKEDDEKKE